MAGLDLRFLSSSVSHSGSSRARRAPISRTQLRFGALGLCALAFTACGDKKDDTDGTGGAVTTEPTNSTTGSMTATTSMPTTTMTATTTMPTMTMTATTTPPTTMPTPTMSATTMPTPTMSATDLPAMSTTAAPTMEPSAPAQSSSGGGDTDPPASSTSDGGAGGGDTSGGDGGAGGGDTMPPAGEFQLTIGAITSHDNEDCAMDACGGCERFPAENVSICMGPDTSPEITWTPGPDGTMVYAVILRDMANDLNHWGVWNIPGEVTSLPAGLASGAPSGDLQGAVQKSFSGEVYAGSGACDHVYEFRVYALTETLNDTNLNSVVTALDGGDAPQTFVRVRSMCPAEEAACKDARHIMPDCTP